MALGFIYIMSNPSFSDGKIKIGKSMNDPSFRKAELNTTGLPEPFEIEYFAFVEDYDSVEIIVHNKLSEYRPNKNREFFNCSIPKAILTIQQSSTVKYEEVFYKSPEEINEIKKQEEAKRHAEKEKERIEQEQEKQRLEQENRERYFQIETDKLDKIFHSFFYERTMTFIRNEPFIHTGYSTTLTGNLGNFGVNYVPFVLSQAFNPKVFWEDSKKIAEAEDATWQEVKKIRNRSKIELRRKLMDNRKKIDLEEFVKTYESEVRKMCERVKEQHGIDSGIYRSEW